MTSEPTTLTSTPRSWTQTGLQWRGPCMQSSEWITHRFKGLPQCHAVNEMENTFPENFMTWSYISLCISFSILLINDQENAEMYLDRSYSLYVRPPFNVRPYSELDLVHELIIWYTYTQVWTEKQTSVGAVNFITGAAGFLQVWRENFNSFKSNVWALS